MHPQNKTIWRPFKVVSFPIEKSIGNVRTTGQCSFWKIKPTSHEYEFNIVGAFFNQ